MSGLWNDGDSEELSGIRRSPHRFAPVGDPIEGSNAHHYTAMRLGSEALLRRMMAERRVK